MISHPAHTTIGAAGTPSDKTVEELARRRVGAHRGFAVALRHVSFDHAHGVLTIRGRVASFYLKQVIQTLVRDLQGVEQIDNQADVVSATGLSSERNPLGRRHVQEAGR